jgi:hypothetical protein
METNHSANRRVEIGIPRGPKSFGARLIYMSRYVTILSTFMYNSTTPMVFFKAEADLASKVNKSRRIYKCKMKPKRPK